MSGFAQCNRPFVNLKKIYVIQNTCSGKKTSGSEQEHQHL